MWLDEHPYIAIYLFGCVLFLLLSLFKVVIFYTIDWITKANILNMNIRKIMPPNEMTVLQNVSKFIGILLFEMLLSWINVVLVLWQIVTTLIRILRDLLTPAPEAIKILRFPLRNNPKMAREAVWAYVIALNVKAGVKRPDEYGLVEAIREISENYPNFNYRDALAHLGSLEAIPTEKIKHAGQIFEMESDSNGNSWLDN